MNSMNEKQFIETLGLFAKKGYQIIKDPKKRDDLPSFLHSFNYYPDFIIKSDSLNYIIELSTSKTFKNKERSEKIIEEIEKHKAWIFILVQTDTVTEDDKKNKERSEMIIEDVEKSGDQDTNIVQTDIVIEDDKKNKERSEKIIEDVEKHSDLDINVVQTEIVMEDEKPEEIYESVKKGYQQLKSVIETQQFEKHPAFILPYAWVLVESMLRKLTGKEVFDSDTKLLLKEGVSQDIIDYSESLVLKDLQLLYHQLSQGNFEIVINKSRLDPLIKVINKLYVKYFSK